MKAMKLYSVPGQWTVHYVKFVEGEGFFTLCGKRVLCAMSEFTSDGGDATNCSECLTVYFSKPMYNRRASLIINQIEDIVSHPRISKDNAMLLLMRVKAGLEGNILRLQEAIDMELGSEDDNCFSDCPMCIRYGHEYSCEMCEGYGVVSIES